MVAGQLMRIPYTAPLPPPTILPTTASSLPGALEALTSFLTSSSPPTSPSTSPSQQNKKQNTLLLTGAGISVASGLADYRGDKGTYTLNKTYRPIYYHEFVASHAARKRYWARSFLGWHNLSKSRPNVAHAAVARLGHLGFVSSVITQNVDSFHPIAHPHIKTLELHGYLRSAVCITCRTEYNRQLFQRDLSALNPTWHSFLTSIISSGALTTENPEERRRLGLKTNADGDVDVPGVDYTTFRYPACPSCLANPGKDKDGNKRVVNVDNDGAFVATNSTAGILKPNVIMFGESIPDATKIAAEQAVDEAARLLVLGSSLATYSAWRLVKRAREQGMPIGIVNIGGVRGEEQFFAHLDRQNRGDLGLRCAHVLEDLLPMLVEELARRDEGHTGLLVASAASAAVGLGRRFVPAPWA